MGKAKLDFDITDDEKPKKEPDVLFGLDISALQEEEDIGDLVAGESYGLDEFVLAKLEVLPNTKNGNLTVGINGSKVTFEVGKFCICRYKFIATGKTSGIISHEQHAGAKRKRLNPGHPVFTCTKIPNKGGDSVSGAKKFQKALSEKLSKVYPLYDL